MANAGKGHLFGDAFFNAEYFHVGDETAGKTYINMENEQLEIHELKEPLNDNDAATKKYVDDNAGGGGGGGSGDAYIEYTELTTQQVAEACISTVEGGGTPWLVGNYGAIYKLDTYAPDDGVLIFTHNELEVEAGTITYWVFKVLAWMKDGDTWALDEGTRNIVL